MTNLLPAESKLECARLLLACYVGWLSKFDWPAPIMNCGIAWTGRASDSWVFCRRWFEFRKPAGSSGFAGSSSHSTASSCSSSISCFDSSWLGFSSSEACWS